MTGSVAVVTDSAASLPSDLVEQWGIRVVPMQVILDDAARLEGEQIGPAEVLKALESGARVTTSQPSIAQFEAAFEQAVAEGASHVVAVLISGKISGTVSGALAAAERADAPVTIVDTSTLAMATGFAALAAAFTARQGGTPEQVAAAAREVAGSTRCLFTVATLEHLRRGGRISPAVAAVGKVLGVRPVLDVHDGEVVVAERVRSTQRARAAVVDLAAQAAAQMAHPAVAVMALGDDEAGDQAVASLSAATPDAVMTIRTEVSAVLAGHAGPGTLAVVVADLPEGLR
ncbi:DegV family protein [Demequina sp.]|uniref:DegV family protein n=1 Tax=Demequina sp. TaxID=2050685 RepID=UPI003A8699FF